jgi:hypothetical protein
MEKRHNSIDCPSTLQTIPKEKEFNFYTMQNGKPMSEEQSELISKLAENIWEEEI